MFGTRIKIKALKASIALVSAMLAMMPTAAMAQEDSVTQQVRELIGNYHVSGVTEESLANQSIEQMIKGLKDPYTVFFSQEDYGQFSNSLENSFVGMGARIGIDDQGVYLTEIFAGSPAEIAGLKKDDYVRAIDGVPASVTSIDEVRNKIVGKEGTKVKVTILRGTQEMTFEITRRGVNVPEVYSSSLTNGVGYIQITDFSSDADEDFDKQLKALQAKGLKSLILDVRNNPGGLVDTALNIAKHFVKEGTLIHTRDRNGVDDPVLITGGTTVDVPVYILANENSASASEVLSGALQDYNVAKVIGMQTFGKGSVQQILPLDKNNSLKLTVEEYLTPNKRKVNKVGITPDLKVDGPSAQFIAALHETGIADIRVNLTKHGATFNGVDLGFGFGSFREDGQWYVSTRGLAALIDAKITWNDTNHSVVITDANGAKEFPVEKGKLIIDYGTSYINLDLFASYFPQLHVTSQGDMASIQATKGN
ncbi:S41 family peptidase [Paenibacillus roseipurpureus]|uniref:S41 family peptidase n=1 Tax=Paenibacillus roseopurpureus TaxID=2918901 RepID=A0AA96LK05_9BACL|nr:S41 family peptidase [Paenibacillus sp. MBLB1832]WNR42299.1 S41 family peptidase [Paenibacillus sp. MBLB1832]